MLAIKDRPKEAKEFLLIVESNDVASKTKRKHAGDVMYRGATTFRWLYEKAMATDRDDILELSRIGKALSKKNVCSNGECSAHGDIHEEQLEIII